MPKSTSRSKEVEKLLEDKKYLEGVVLALQNKLSKIRAYIAPDIKDPGYIHHMYGEAVPKYIRHEMAKDIEKIIYNLKGQPK